jgi:hypothetical protein
VLMSGARNVILNHDGKHKISQDMSYILKMHMWNFTLNRDFILSDSHEYLLSDYHSADLAIELDAWNILICRKQCRSNRFHSNLSPKNKIEAPSIISSPECNSDPS